MKSATQLLATIALAATVLAGCGPAPSGGTSGAVAPAAPAQPKILVVGSREAAPVLSNTLDSKADVIDELISAGFVGADPVGRSTPLVAENVPSLDNGLWKVSPD